ncbi:Forkhead-associated (FHA) domain protein [Kalmanozyma brasiliensis GHG001]|uniref:Forkhead-associated (FHA) domain protein n=1 Tax=Kalmanozyma brasiliensis (strain GHG001) TaxID=1365824 RepID=UPI0028680EDA|nr:Forkhead-associated (FHA) domain protein [Kalmanozyma brasiliensis GHG001]EST06386.2 Forkhead-associated (FHA) domain protein [Kalmanozyma brasiliensis GHG001]
MWLLQGRFAENSRQELSKLLKYGQTYTLGRKIPADIVIDSKFVSRVSCHITIASEDTIASHAAGLSDPAAFHKDLSVRPRVTIRFEANKSRKTFGVTQQPNSARRSSGSEPVEVQVPADHEHEIQDGDSFALTTTISLRLVWKPLAVCFAAKIKESAIAPLRKPALQLGIYLSPPKSKWRDGYTHLCVAQVKPTESVHCALLHAAAIVSIEYFQELFCRAELPRHDPVSLETSFEELDLLTYQPTFDQQELSELPDLHKLLLPQERRTYMLKGTTCVLFALPTEESEMSIYKSILATAGAHVFIHNPQAESLQTKADFAKLLMPYKSSALSYWRNSGSKARSEAPDEGLVVLVASKHDYTPWKNACTIACTNLRIAMPMGFEAITSAVFSADVRAHLNILPNISDGQDESIQPAVAQAAPSAAAQPSPQREPEADVTALEQAPSNAPFSSAAAARQASRTVSTPAPAAEELPAAAQEPPSTFAEPTRRPLTRRTRKPTHDAEEADAVENRDAGPSGDQSGGTSVAALQDQDRSHMDTSASQLTRAERSGLTRRTGASRARRSDIFDSILQSEGGASAGLEDVNGSLAGDSQSLAAVPRSRRYRMDLDEEDRAQSESIAQTQGSEGRQADANGYKRKTPPLRRESNEDQDHSADAQSPTSKRTRTTGPEVAEDGDLPESQIPQAEPARIVRNDPTTEGLSNGAQPDSEPQFLQALNTQRAKGKRMDDFDVEFNRLQIAKPGTQSQLSSLGGTLRSRPGRGAQQQQDASNAPIDEDYEAFKQMAEEELRIHVRGNFVQVDFVPLVRTKKVVDARSQTPQGTDGVPNFKKFRPKAVGSAAPANASQRPRISMVLPESNDYGLGQSYWEDPDGQSGPAAEASIGSRRASEAVQTSRGKGKSRSRVALDPASVEETAVDLGLDGRDSMDSEDEADMTTMLERRHGSKSRTAGASGSAARVRKRPAAVVQDSDDDMATPSNAAAGRKKRATARTATMLVDSDDDHGSEDGGGNDDDGNFAGFGRSTSTRRRRDPPASGTSRARRSVF